MAKQNKVVSFTLEPTLKKYLDRMKRPSVYVQKVVTVALGRCPCCGGKWKRKPSATSAQAAKE